MGPSLPSDDVDYEELEKEKIIRRAEKMKDKLEGKEEKKVERESWMIDLPDFRTVSRILHRCYFFGIFELLFLTIISYNNFIGRKATSPNPIPQNRAR